jgi:hypothetical protein
MIVIFIEKGGYYGGLKEYTFPCRSVREFNEDIALRKISSGKISG